MHTMVQRQQGFGWWIAAGLIVLLSNTAISRYKNEQSLDAMHSQLVKALPQVKAVVARAASREQDLVLPADVQPIQTVPLFSRVTGYMSRRFVDIGDQVTAGQLIAVIETPETDKLVNVSEANRGVSRTTLTAAESDRENLQSQFEAADSTVKQAQTNLDFSTVEARRYRALADDGAVSKEQRDQAVKQFQFDKAQLSIAEMTRHSLVAQLETAKHKIESARSGLKASTASLSQSQAIDKFQKIIAPCDGVITDRLIDNGALVTAGTSGGTPILVMAQTDVLRVYVDVPQSESRLIKVGDLVSIRCREQVRLVTGVVSNISGSLDGFLRTLKVEIKVGNKQRALMPGAFAEVTMHCTSGNSNVVIPGNCVMTDDKGTFVMVVKNGKVVRKNISIARDSGCTVEADKGLMFGDLVLQDPPPGIIDGMAVDTVVASSFADGRK